MCFVFFRPVLSKSKPIVREAKFMARIIWFFNFMLNHVHVDTSITALENDTNFFFLETSHSQVPVLSLINMFKLHCDGTSRLIIFTLKFVPEINQFSTTTRLKNISKGLVRAWTITCEL